MIVILVAAWGALPAGAVEASPLLGLRDDPTRHLTIKWQGTIRAEAGRPGSWIEQFLEQRFNVTFKPTFIVYFSYPRVLPIRLLTGNVPDVTWVFGRDLPRFSRQGFALELPYEVIRQHAPAYVRLLNAHTPENWLLTYAHGKNYGLPLFTIESHQPRPGYWRMDWLRKVGLNRAPETLEEMREALWRFRHQDPDGNGLKDTYGMCPWKPPIVPEIVDRSFEEIFAAHGVVATGWMLREGKIVWGGILPETRAALALLREWYADGLIYPDYMTMPTGSLDLMKKFTSGQVGYLYALGDYRTFDLSFPQSMAAVIASVHPGAEMVPAPFPRGPGGQAGGRGSAIGTSPDRQAALMFGAHLADEPEKVVRILRMLEEMAVDEELFLAARLGRRGLHWDWDQARGFRALPPYDSRQHASRQLLHWDPEPWQNWGYYAPFGSSQEMSNRYKTGPHREFDAKWRAARFTMEDEIVHAGIVPSADKYLADLVQMQVTLFTEIITGRRPLGDFDRFVGDWHKGGGTQLTAEANAIYAVKPGILARGGVTAGLPGDPNP